MLLGHPLDILLAAALAPDQGLDDRETALGLG
ncbi:hypothetical protein J2851_005048 [Azospirillum rugosum]|uniref:Uncharacterized protein n=1 Tax=Azospirillum rugosum TaxID=416170 RepID=A0ABS4SRR0_9PROT|nr:hypothetical protein [Azospirillum rugosum]MDQ0528619.1 hypothetical protein [Azospirillum rugosum]